MYTRSVAMLLCMLGLGLGLYMMLYNICSVCSVCCCVVCFSWKGTLTGCGGGRGVKRHVRRGGRKGAAGVRKKSQG